MASCRPEIPPVDEIRRWPEARDRHPHGVQILGPLTNPAGADAQVIGVADPAMGRKMAETLGRLGSTRALVVHGNDGLDEITIGGETKVWEFNAGSVSEYTISPEDFGFSRTSSASVKAGSVEESVAVLRSVLAGETGPARTSC